MRKFKKLVVAKEPMRCMLAINNKILESVTFFKYLYVKLTVNYVAIDEEVKLANVHGCLDV